MSKFKFRLATLRKIRQTVRDQRRAHLAEAYRAEEILREQSEQVLRELDGLKAVCREASGPGPVDVDRLTQAHIHDLGLKAHQQQLARQTEIVDQEIETRREALVQATRQVRVLDKLEEKQLARHRHEENRRQIAELDEVARQRAVREASS
jgi:flagellar FliJ protein